MSTPRRSNRRQFLKGEAARQAIDDLVPAGDAEPREAAAPEAYLLQLGRRAMACQFEVFFNAGQYPNASDAALTAFDLVDRLEEQMTVYRDTSDISRINRFAFDRPVQVEPLLFQLLSRAGELHHATTGAFDITSGPLSKAWGFFRRSGAVPGDADLAEARERVGGEHLQLHPETSTVRFLKPGMEINLGAIGKGYALDRVAEQMVSAGIGHFLWHGGQSSLVARGACGQAADGSGGWVVDLRHPLRPERSVVEIRLRDRALATSGAGTQFFRHEGRRYGHILDPRSGRPAEGVYSATVVAPTAADADALSTALYVLGPEAAGDWCRQHPEVGLLMFAPGRGRQSVEMLTHNLDAADWRQTGAL
ncbi:MAG TPA: FAD:protein FMN transferase [Pirellulales bacterium]|nr:FAD:protein FMN transferase [Pirellulales bacterium]